MQNSPDPLDRLGNSNSLAVGLGLAVAIEVATCFIRFGLGLQTTRDTGWMAAFTFGYRIHHGYIGVLLIASAFAFLPAANGYRHLLLIMGYALFFSDLMHHLAILWPLTGTPQFDIRYP